MSDAAYKRCNKCGKTKPVTEFSRKAGNRDGLNTRCKPCAAEDNRLWRKRWTIPHESLLRKRQLDRLYRERDRERMRIQQRSFPSAKKPKKVDPEKAKARHTLNNAVASGRVVKPETCSRCDSVDVIHGHHEDYSKPLEVEWLCPPCHGLLQRKPDLALAAEEPA